MLVIFLFCDFVRTLESSLDCTVWPCIFKAMSTCTHTVTSWTPKRIFVIRIIRSGANGNWFTVFDYTVLQCKHAVRGHVFVQSFCECRSGRFFCWWLLMFCVQWLTHVRVLDWSIEVDTITVVTAPPSPFPQIDIIGAMLIVWRVRGKIIRSVLCNIVCNNCAQCNAHTYEQT